MKNNKRDAALEYVRRGWEIFPVPPNTKAGYSVQRRGFDNGKPWGKTTSVKEVRAYWKRLPHANVGVPMGVGSGVFDIECDTVEGHPTLKQDGAVSLQKLEAANGKLPLTAMFQSPSGSVHRLYRHPGGDVRIRSGALVPGVDIRGDGAMAVAPPSKTPKGAYRWINRRRIATAPAWLLAMVRKQEYATHEADPFAQFANSVRQTSIAELTLAVAMIPNTLKTDRETWVRVGFAIWSATDGSDEGYQLFRAWSRRWPHYVDGGKSNRDTLTFWKTVKTMPHDITVGTIFFMAEEAVPDWKERCIAHEPSVIMLIEEFHELMH